MPQVILQPALNWKEQEHYRDTVESSVRLSRICRYISDENWEELKKLYPEGAAYVWGVVPGVQNSSYYQDMEPGAIVLFYRRGLLDYSETAMGVLGIFYGRPVLSTKETPWNAPSCSPA